VAIDPATGRLIGVARYIALPGRTGDAEVAALVVDDWQHRGVGTRLMHSLSERAQANRVRRFIAVVDQENRPVIELLERAGATHVGVDRQLTFAITAAAWQARAARSDGHYLADSSEAVSGGVVSG
jgi:RimJ/RimL family protein N-acetyltransferase